MSDVSNKLSIKDAFNQLVDFIDKYGIGYVSKVFDIIEADNTTDFRNEAILLVFKEVLYEYNIPKQIFLSTDECPNKRYARIVIVNLLRDHLGSVSLGEIALLLRLNSTNHVSFIYRESLGLNPKIKTDNFALNLINIMSEKIKKLKENKEKQIKAKNKQSNTSNPTLLPQSQLNN